jgi:hypothetical protein
LFEERQLVTPKEQICTIQRVGNVFFVQVVILK